MDGNDDAANEYRGEMVRIEAEIHRLGALLGAQGPDSQHRPRLETRIEELTTSLFAWEANLERLTELDRRETKVRRDMEKSRRTVDRAPAGWFRAARTSGVVGCLLVLGSLALAPPLFVPLVGAVLLAISVGGFLKGVKVHRAAVEDVDRQGGALEDMEAERVRLLPSAK